MRLDLALGFNQSDSWVVGIHSSSSEVNYTLKAWCSGMKPFRFVPLHSFSVNLDNHNFNSPSINMFDDKFDVL